MVASHTLIKTSKLASLELVCASAINVIGDLGLLLANLDHAVKQDPNDKELAATLAATSHNYQRLIGALVQAGAIKLEKRETTQRRNVRK
jgi:hypothetical protein